MHKRNIEKCRALYVLQANQKTKNLDKKLKIW